MKIYSIKEIVSATNDLLVSENKSEIKKDTKTQTEKISPETEKIIIEAEKALALEKIKKHKSEEPLLLENEVSLVQTLNQLNYKIKIKPEVKNHMIEELYAFLKKKIKKNTLKLIIDEQIEIKNLYNKINFLKKNENQLKQNYLLLRIKNDIISKNYKTLNNDNDNLRNTIEQTKIQKGQLDLENAKLKIDLKEESEISKEIIKKNRSLEINNEELKSTVSRYIINYKKIIEEVSRLKNSSNEDLKDEILKVKFYQNENIRLSSELLSVQKMNENIKENLKDIKIEKESISNKIIELNKAIVAGKSNIIPSSFTQEATTVSEKITSDIQKEKEEAKKEISNMSDTEQKKLDDVINRIFSKI
jgi:hypothetical protein